jgi:hypothetical protein
MSKIKLIGVTAVLLTVLSFVWVTQHQATARLAEAERVWRQEADQVARLTAENARLSNVLVQVRRSQTRANDQLRELLRLRGELNALRQHSNQIAQLKAVLAAPEATPPKETAPAKETPEPPPPPPQANVLARESWAFAGYATPEAALQTVVWAMSNGDAATYLASLTPAGLQYFEQQLEGKSENELATMLRDEVAELRGLRLDRKRDAGDGKVSFVLSSKDLDDGGNKGKDEQVLVLKNVQGEWRVVAAPDE